METFISIDIYITYRSVAEVRYMTKKSKKKSTNTKNKEPEHGAITTIKKPKWHKLKQLIEDNKEAIHHTDYEKDPTPIVVDVSENGLDICVKPSSMRSRITTMMKQIYGKDNFGHVRINRIRGKHGEPHIKFYLHYEDSNLANDPRKA